MTDPLPRLAGSVLLRRLDIADVAAFQAYRKDAELGRYQGWTPRSDADARSFLAEMSATELFVPGQWSQIGIAESGSSLLVGDIGLFLAEDSREAEIGFTLCRESQHAGIATAAVGEAIRLVFGHTGVERVLGITDARNTASIRLLERVGMRWTKSQNTMFRGEACIEHTYAVERKSVSEGFRG